MSGKYYEELEVGMRIRHATGRTITEMDNVMFSSLTMNPQPLHLDEHYSAQTQFGRRLVNGIFTMGLMVGICVSDLTEGTIVANLGYDNVRHPKPVFHGDTIYVESEVLDKRDSRSNPAVGIVTIKHTARNQDDVVVCELERTVMFHKKPS